MKAVLRFFIQKSVIQLAGIIALCTLIWWGGPWVAFAGRSPLLPEFNRLLAILGVVIVWAIYILFNQARASRADKQLIADLSASPEDPEKAAIARAQDDEAAEIRRKFERALVELKKARSKGRRDRQYLYEQPWYIIIGAPGSGKTTALVNSGLKFPLVKRPGENAVRGVGGTRNCDWFFTEDAIFIDTAGRYTSQDSHQPVDEAAWSSFLDLIKKYRPRRPINGVLVTMSMSDLLQSREDERGRYAGNIRQRIQELYGILGVRFPIYMLFTKCDLVAGFTDFFADLDGEERTQVWGETFPDIDTESAEDQVARFGRSFDALLGRLNRRIFLRIREERDIQRQGLILDFPQQMSLLKPRVMGFLYDTFSESRFDTDPLLRGVYFTSGTQEGTPIDRVLGRMAEAYGFDGRHQPIFSGRGKTYFITRLLKNVVIPEAELTAAAKGVERRRRTLQLAVCSALLVLTAAMITLWSVSYTRNKVAIGNIEKQLEIYRNAGSRTAVRDMRDVKPLLVRLNVLKAAHDVYKDRSWWMTFGLYQGDKLQSEINRVYTHQLKNDLLPLIKGSLEKRLRQGVRTGKVSDSTNLFELLKVYLMLGDPEKMDPGLAGSMITKEWNRTFSREPRVQAELIAHSSPMLSEPLEPMVLNKSLIAGVRRKLNSIPLSQQVYTHLKSEALPDHSHDFRLTEHLGRYGGQVFEKQTIQAAGIPGLYTRYGYTTYFKKQGLDSVKKALEQNWVLDNPAADQAGDLNRLYDDLQKLYFDEYRRLWRSLLNDIRIRRARGVNDTIQLLDLLSSPDTPIRPLLEAVEENTSLTRVTAEKPQAKQPVESTDSSSIPSALNQQFQNEDIPAALRNMERHFKELNALVHSTGKNPPPLDNILNHLAQLRDVLMLIGNSAKSEEQALKMAMERMSGAGADDAIKKAKLEFARLPRPLRKWFQPLTASGWKLTLATAKSELNSIWKTEVLTPYRAGLDKRYPIYANSPYDITMADFCRFFAPDGIIDSFFQEHLKPFVDTNRSRWRQLSLDKYAMGLSSSVLKQFQYADKIRRTFFESGGQTPSVEFELKPLFLDENIATFRLNIEGQTIVYRHGPTRTSKMHWPGPETDTGVRFTFQTLDGREIHQSEEGPWALFRVLDKAYIDRDHLPDRFQITFQEHGFRVRFEFRASSVNHPFKSVELRSFRCPGDL